MCKCGCEPESKSARWGRGRTATLFIASVVLMALFMSALQAQAQDITVVSYDLGEITITQGWFPPESRFFNMPVRLRGVLAVPPGEGPFPVAFFVHGSYVFCTAPLVNEADVYPCPEEHDLRQFEGFTYLAEALAARGYLAMVPDTSAEHTVGFGEPVFGERGIQIIEAHLNALAGGEGFGLDLAGKADMARLMMVSHSRGGPLSIIYTIDERATHPVFALALLTPAAPPEGVIIPDDMPTALVIAQCDGDILTREPMVYADEQLSPLRPTLTAFFTIPRGTHNAFSTQLLPDFFPNPDCEGLDLLEPELQRAFTVRFVPDFLDMALGQVTFP